MNPIFRRPAKLSAAKNYGCVYFYDRKGIALGAGRAWSRAVLPDPVQGDFVKDTGSRAETLYRRHGEKAPRDFQQLLRAALRGGLWDL